MKRLLVLFVLGLTGLFAADDGWGKVKSTESGTELRIKRVGKLPTLVANLDEVTDESVIVTTKTEQISVPKEEIERIDFRKGSRGRQVTRQVTNDNTPLDKEAARPKPGPARTPGPVGSSSSSVTMGGKPSYELLWKRN